MRPIRLEIDGIASYRQRTVLDFTDTDLFALVGSTGSGKSSVVDCMTLSLYGAVPRHGTGTIAPALTTGRKLGKVRFDFAIGDQTYTAVRVLQRTKTAVTTKEARLETATGDVVAGDAAGVTDAVRQLTGLGFAEFCRTVVLPQGRFAEFLHATAKERQDLLVELLDLDLYRQLGEEARQEADRLDRELAASRRLATQLEHATDDEVERARHRVDTVATLQGEVTTMLDDLHELKQTGQSRREAKDEAERLAAAARDVAVPSEVTDLTGQLARLDADLEDARRTAKEAADRADGLRQDAAGLPPADMVDRTIQLFGEVDRRRQALSDLTAEAARAEERRLAADAAVAQADSAVEDARRRLQEARDTHAAWLLSARLSAGDDCPVCLQAVDTPPAADLPPDDEVAAAQDTLDGRLAAADDARRHLEQVTVAARDLERKHDRDTAQLAALDSQLTAATVDLQLGDAPADLDRLTGLQARVGGAAEAVTAAEHDATVAAGKAEQARTVRDRAAASVDGAWDTYHQVRDRLAAASPPPPTGDLASSWQTLAGWASEATVDLDAAVQAATDQIAQTVAAYRTLAARIETAAADADVPVTRADTAAADIGAALGAARTRLERLAAEAASRAELADQIAADETAHGQWHELGLLLRTNRFERWMLDRATRQLADIASDTLGDLTGGGYSLDLDDKGRFEIIDHAAAGERRPAKTLSGGETFLASLSLALALADQVTAAAGRTARLETLLLDEGFGTLDPDTLDIVASAIEELGATSQRTVGLITHVEALAARMPTRFEITKGPDGSQVTVVQEAAA